MPRFNLLKPFLTIASAMKWFCWLAVSNANPGMFEINRRWGSYFTASLQSNLRMIFKVILRKYRKIQVMVKLLYFMRLVELLGCSQEELKLPEGVVDVAGLLAHLGQRGEAYRTALADGSGLQITINKKFVDPAAMLKEGDEVAFFPKTR